MNTATRLLKWGAPTVALVAFGLWVSVTPPAPASDAPVVTTPLATAAVTRRDIVQTEEVNGTLGYGEAVAVPNRAEGVVTWVPESGDVLRPGNIAYRVDERPTVIMEGTVPAYRSMRYGDEGADVRQLQEYLVAAGFADFEPDGEFGRATRAAVRAWQDKLGVKDTGVVEISDVLFTPGSVRVAETASPGTVASDSVLKVTSSEARVEMALDPARRHLATVGDEVEVELPDGTMTQGTVASVDDTVVVDDNGKATVAVTVDLAAAVPWDGAPVDVNLVRRSAEDVLAVPVTALLALAEGGFAVERVGSSGTELVAVDVGDSADGWVEVSGEISESDEVVVAP